MSEINIARDFSRTPMGRTIKNHGQNSGEALRTDYLAPKLQQAIDNDDTLTVVLDGVAGYAASFLDEAFGGLISIDSFSPDDISQHLKIVAESLNYEVYKSLSQDYIDEAQLKNS